MDVGRAGQRSELEALRSDNLATRSTKAVGAASSSDDTSVAISKSADLLKRLSALNQRDPERFKLLMGQMSANLRAAANPQSGAVGAQLNQLSAGLARVANTGDVSTLTPTLEAAPSFSANRAVAAYRKNLPTPAPSETLTQAMDYVRSVLDPQAE